MPWLLPLHSYGSRLSVWHLSVPPPCVYYPSILTCLLTCCYMDFKCLLSLDFCLTIYLPAYMPLPATCIPCLHMGGDSLHSFCHASVPLTSLFLTIGSSPLIYICHTRSSLPVFGGAIYSLFHLHRFLHNRWDFCPSFCYSCTLSPLYSSPAILFRLSCTPHHTRSHYLPGILGAILCLTHTCWDSPPASVGGLPAGRRRVHTLPGGGILPASSGLPLRILLPGRRFSLLPHRCLGGHYLPGSACCTCHHVTTTIFLHILRREVIPFSACHHMISTCLYHSLWVTDSGFLLLPAT